VSHAGAVLLTETARVTGLTARLSAALERWRLPRSVHDPGKIVADLAVAVALGGDRLADAGLGVGCAGTEERRRQDPQNSPHSAPDRRKALRRRGPRSLAI
jgi:Transposase DDE domain group 1